MKKKSIIIIGMSLIGSITHAQQGQALGQALTNAASDAGNIANGLATILNVVAGLVGLFGVFRVYSKYQNGDQDTNKAIGQFGGAFIFLIAASAATRAFFGI